MKEYFPTAGKPAKGEDYLQLLTCSGTFQDYESNANTTFLSLDYSSMGIRDS